ncbi:DUF4153 domain-containing protein [Ravibacter arvi]|uniref:DUF4153 domain-containing protein n=1 Tax=Ravibacter arvi TaxID=2051041 RepID=A0ABP8MCW7_9BACT
MTDTRNTSDENRSSDKARPMTDDIRAHFDDPAYLEKMYRRDKVAFRDSFLKLYPEWKGNLLAESWNERLRYEGEELNWGTSTELWLLLAASLLAGFLAKIPSIFGIDEEYFYQRNIGFIVFPILTAYFTWKNNLRQPRILFLFGTIAASLIFINVFPKTLKSDTLVLSGIHLILFLWSLLGLAFSGNNAFDLGRRLNFLRYNGEWVIMTGLILIAGGLMSAFTIGLFELIGIRIEKFYFDNVAVLGLAAAPIVATYLVSSNPQLVNKVSPAIARIFSPLVLIILVVYLIAIIGTGKNPYTDREFLIFFNLLLLAVIGIIFFSIAESAGKQKNRLTTGVLLGLSVITILINGIALSAILFRISEWGFTPNRTAVLGANLLILGNLVLVTIRLFRVAAGKTELSSVGKVISAYLPLYTLWTIIVTFIFPLIFQFK